MSALHAPPEPARGLAGAVQQAVSAFRAFRIDFTRSVWPDADDAWLTVAQLELCRRGAKHGAPIMAVASLAVAQSCAPWISATTRWAWGGSVAAITLVLYAFAVYFSRIQPTSLGDIRIWVVRQTAFMTIYTLAWCSMSAFLWAPDVPINHMFLTLLLAASLAGSITMSASHPPTTAIIIATYAIFLIVPPALSRAPLDHTLAWLCAVFAILMSVRALTLQTHFRRLLTLEHERSDLVESLRLAKQESDRERARAVSAGRAKSQFLSNMNHELRTPMNAILGFSELIMHKAFGAAIDKYAEYAEIIHQSGINLLRLIDDMLDLAKIEGGKLGLRESEFRIAELMGDLFAANEDKAATAQLSLVRTIAPGLPPVYGDERALRQVAANLIANALKYTPPGGTVTLFARLEPDGRMAFGVEDTGVGIAEEDQARVFERFGQGRHDVTSANKGTGLGLAIVKGFAEAHDGEVKLESSPGSGTRVTAYLPAERMRPVVARKTG